MKTYFGLRGEDSDGKFVSNVRFLGDCGEISPEDNRQLFSLGDFFFGASGGDFPGLPKAKIESNSDSTN